MARDNEHADYQGDYQASQKITGQPDMYHCNIVSSPDMGILGGSLWAKPEDKKKRERDYKQDIGSGELSYIPHINFEMKLTIYPPSIHLYLHA